MKTLKEFRSQINEVLKASDPIEKWIDDFVHSKNPKFAGKSTKERIEMAKGAYYGAQKNESAALSQNTESKVEMEEDHLVHVSDGSKYDEVPHEKDIEHVKTGAMHHGGEWAGHSDKGAFFKFKSKEDAEHFKRHVDKCPHRSCYADHVNEAVEYKGIGTDVVDKKKKLNPQPNLLSTKKTVKDFKEEVKKPTGDLKKACWKGYTAVGLKMKDGRKVPNCVPEETQVEEAKVYDPITKKMVATKPIKVQAGGGATRNGVPVETGPSKYKQGLKTEDVDLTEDIKKEYEGLKKHDIKTLRDMIKQQHRIVDTSEFRTKEHAISHILNNKHGNKRVMAALGESDESWAASQEKKKEERLTGKDQGTLSRIRDLMAKQKKPVKESIDEAYRLPSDSETDKVKAHVKANHPNKSLAQVAVHKKTKKIEYVVKDKEGKMSGHTLGEETEQIDEISKHKLVQYIDKASQDVHDKAMAAGSHHAGKSYKDFMANYAKSGKRQAGIIKAAVKLAREEVEQIEEATVASRKYDFGTMKTIHHGKSFSIPLHPEHHQPIAKLKHGESHSFKDETGAKWKATRDNDTVHFHGGSYGTQKTSVPHSSLQESRGHKVLATFFKNREVAQRAFNGDTSKDAEAAKKDVDLKLTKWKNQQRAAKTESVNPALMAILKKRQEAQKKKAEDKKKVSEAMTQAASAAEPKRTKSTSKQFISAPIPGTKRVAGSKSDSNEPGNQLKEDLYTADYKIKYYVDPVTGENKQRKIRPHRVNFANSKMRGEPVQKDAQGDYGMKESYVNEGGFDNYDEIAKELIKRHGKNVDTGHINDLAGERDTHRGLDHSEVMHHVKKHLKGMEEENVYDEKWTEYKGKTFKKEQRMLKFNDYLKEAALSAKQKKIAAIAGDKDKIDADDLAALRAGKKPTKEEWKEGAGTAKMNEAKKCMDEDDMEESGLRMAAHAAHKAGKKDFEFQGKTYPVKVQKEEVEHIEELDKKTLGSYVKKASADIAKREVRIDRAMDASGSNYNEPSMQKALNKNVKRVAGLNKAADKLAKEEVEQIDELSKKTLQSYQSKIGRDLDRANDAWPHGTGDDDEDRKLNNRVKGDELASKKIKAKGVNEESEQIDELSKKTLGSYVKKASHDARINGQIGTDFRSRGEYARKQSNKDSFERLHTKYLSKAWKRDAGIAKAVDKLTKEDVQLDEGKMKELAIDLKDMSHDEFHKQYGKPKSHFDPTSFKKPVQPGKEMDRAKELAQRGMKSMTKEEVELEESYPTKQHFQAIADIIKTHEDPKKRSELAHHHAGVFKGQNPRFDHTRFMHACGVHDSTIKESQEDSPYLKATLSFMDESKFDDYQDALRAKKATQSAFDKDFKPDTTHPHIKVVKGTQYGGENQKDDENDEKPDEPKEKRGRGRPAGSKSGARV